MMYESCDDCNRSDCEACEESRHIMETDRVFWDAEVAG